MMLFVYQKHSLNSLVSLDDHNLSIQGYSLIRTDHPDDVKRGGVCLYFKENSTLKVTDNSFIAQCTVCEITLQNKKGHVVVNISITKLIYC